MLGLALIILKMDENTTFAGYEMLRGISLIGISSRMPNLFKIQWTRISSHVSMILSCTQAIWEALAKPGAILLVHLEKL